MFDHLMFLIEVILLIWVVIQGEKVCFYEREVWRMNAERYAERAKWRREKQEQSRKKTATKTSASSESITSLSKSETNVSANKTPDAPVAGDPSNPPA